MSVEGPPGMTLTLERSYDLLRWETVQEAAVATSPMVLIDPLSSGPLQRFWRLSWPGGDATAPVISNLRVMAMDDGQGQRVLVLKSEATDDTGVAAVVYSEAENGNPALLNDLAGVVAQSGSTFSLSAGAMTDEVISRFFKARASDAAGNTGHSELAGFALVDPDRLEAIDPVTGEAIPGQLVRIDGTGQLQAFAFRPAGASALGREADLRLEFRDGAALRESGGRWVLEFTNGKASFGPGSPIRFTQDLVKTGGAISVLPLEAGQLSLEALATAFGVNPADGIEVTLYDRWPARWLGGFVEDHGIRQPRFALPSIGVPLPEFSRVQSGDTLDLFQASSVSMVFSQPFVLPGLPGAPQVFIREGRPLSVSLDALGTPRLDGTVQLVLESGMRLDAHLEYEGTSMRFVMTDTSAGPASLSAVVTALPDDPAASVPESEVEPALNSALSGLALQREAWRLISATSGGVAEADASGIEQPLRPRPLTVASNPLAAALAAWGIAAVVPDGDALPAPSLDALLTEIQRQCASLRMEDLLPVKLALLRLQQGTISGRIPSSIATALTQTQAAVDGAFSARLLDVNGVSLARLGHICGQWNELRLQAPLLSAVSQVEAMSVELRSWMEGVMTASAAGYGVEVDAYDSTTNPGLGDLEVAEASALVQWLLAILEIGDDLGLSNTAGSTLRDEWAVQAGGRLTLLARKAMIDAEAKHDSAAFRQALLDLTRCAALRSHVLISSVAQSMALLPSVAELSTAWQRWQAVTALDHQGFSLLHSPAWHAGELRALRDILDLTPVGVTTIPALAQRALDAAGRLLADRTTTQALEGNTDADALMLLIECGTLRITVAMQLGLPMPLDWESGMLPLLMDQLSRVATTIRAPVPLHEAASLLEESTRRRLMSSQGLADARLALVAAADAILGLRSVVIQDTAAAENEAADAGGPPSGTLVLPGDIRVSQLGGSLAFDHESETLSGNFTGQVAIPNLGGALTIQHGSITSDGDFEIVASGTLTLPPGAGNGFSATLTIPSTSPVRIAYRVDGMLAFEGAALLSLSNGMSVYIDAAFLDPVYQFSFEARGLALRFLTDLSDYLPAFALPPVIAEQADYLEHWAALLESLGGTVESMTPEEPAAVPPPAEEASPPPAMHLPPEESKAVLATANVAALGATEADPLPPDAWKNMAEQIRSTLGGGLHEIRSAMGLSGALPPPAPEAIAFDSMLASPPPSAEPVLLQFDLGSSVHVHSGSGPGQADDVFPQINDWVSVASDKSVPAGDKSIDVSFGQQRLLIKPEASPYSFGSVPLLPFDSGSNSLPSFFNNDLMRDGVETLPVLGQTSKGVALVMRIGNLSPSFYVVAANSMRRMRSGTGSSDKSDDIITFGVWSDIVGDARLRRPVPLDDAAVDLGVWKLGSNYALDVVPLNVGESLLIHSAPGPSWGATIGRGSLNAVQLLQIPLQIIEFKATPATTSSSRVEPGTKVKLDWLVYGASQVQLDPGGGSGLHPVKGSLIVTPRKTTTYALTADHAELSATRSVTV